MLPNNQQRKDNTMNDEQLESNENAASKALTVSTGSHPFATKRYYEYRILKKRFEGRKATLNEWKEIVKTMTEKEKEVFFFYRDSDCQVKENVIPSDCHKALGISKKALNGRVININRKKLIFFSAN